MKKKVLVTGWYHAGNFGDDLMAVIMGMHLRDVGTDPYILNLREMHKEYHDLKMGELPVNWTKDYDAVIFGGGGVYANLSILNGKRDEYDFLLEKIVDEAQLASIPFYVISAGGDEQFDKGLLPIGRRKMFEYAEFHTVRNEYDMDLYTKIGNEKVYYYPDMLWRTNDFFQKEIPTQEMKGDNREVAVNIELKGGKVKRKFYSFLFFLLAKCNPNIHFTFLNIWYGSESVVSSLPAPNLKNCSNYKFVNLKDDIDVIASFNIVITSKLHLGLVAMCYGVPVISYAGEDKTKLLFRNIGATDWCLKKYDFLRLFTKVNNTESLNFFRKFLSSDKINKVKQQSLGHYSVIKKILST